MSPGWPHVGLMTRRRGIVPAFALLANFLMLPLFRTFRSPARSLVSSHTQSANIIRPASLEECFKVQYIKNVTQNVTL